MKKILTLCIGLGLAASAFAQASREDAKRVILGGSKNDKKANTSSNPREVILGGGNGNQPSTYPYPNSPSSSTRDQQIAQVNYEYDQKIRSVQNNSYLSAAEKDRSIRQLEADRARRIREINRGYKDRRDDADNDDNYNREHKDKSNKGHHYGWEKGKGNPHKAGGKPGHKDE